MEEKNFFEIAVENGLTDSLQNIAFNEVKALNILFETILYIEEILLCGYDDFLKKSFIRHKSMLNSIKYLNDRLEENKYNPDEEEFYGKRLKSIREYINNIRINCVNHIYFLAAKPKLGREALINLYNSIEDSEDNMSFKLFEPIIPCFEHSVVETRPSSDYA